MEKETSTDIVKVEPRALTTTTITKEDFLKWKRENHPFTIFKEKLIKKAAEEGYIAMTKYLISNGYGRESFLNAAQNGNITAVKTFIEADINLETGGITQQTALIMAAHADDPAILKMLLESGANVDAQDWSNNTALIKAINHEKNNVDHVRILIDAGANLYIRGEEERTALDWAKRRKYQTTVHLLKEGMKKNQEQEQKKKEKPLKSRNQWIAACDDGDDMIFHTKYEPKTETRIKKIFDFNAQILFTEIKIGAEKAHLRQQDFSTVNPFLLEKAEKIRKSPPAHPRRRQL